MTTIERKAKVSYFSREPHKAIGASVYTSGYRDGFLDALQEVRECLEMKSPDDRLKCITKLLDVYEPEGRS